MRGAKGFPKEKKFNGKKYHFFKIVHGGKKEAVNEAKGLRKKSLRVRVVKHKNAFGKGYIYALYVR